MLPRIRLPKSRRGQTMVEYIIIVAVVAIALCFSISLLGLTTITTKVYGYMGYYSLIFVVLPALIWGIAKNKKLEAEGKKA